MITANEIANFGMAGAEQPKRWALFPILLGLAAPAIVLSIIDARVLLDSSVILQVYIFALLAISAGIFFISVFEKGEVTGISIDRKSRQVVINRTGVFARTEQAVDFVDISAFRFETRCDDDGYETSLPVIALTTKDTIALPAGTTESDLVAMRAFVKLR